MWFTRSILITYLATAIAIFPTSSQAKLLGDRFQHRLNNDQGIEAEAMEDQGGKAQSCAEWSTKIDRLQAFSRLRHPGPKPELSNIAYGDAEREKLDLFLPVNTKMAEKAPIIVMVHGGGWCVGDKSNTSMLTNKLARWRQKGFIFISVNYPMVIDGSNAIAQAGYIAKAIAFVQSNANTWGGDASRIILMGHSAGAHLVSMVNADAQIRQARNMRSVLGVVSLDAGAIDVVTQMPNVYPFLKLRYREAFGDSKAGWIAASPFHRLDQSAAPWLGVCSTLRQDDPCGQARAYAEKSLGLGIKAEVLPEAMNHGEINQKLGLPGQYTETVERFMASLDSTIARLLKQ